MSTPLPAHSKHLRERRYEANILGPKNERGGRPCIATGRFTTAAGAMSWADEQHPDAEMVKITFYSARTNWTPQAAGTRTDGEWS